jgi:hypothetical protein
MMGIFHAWKENNPYQLHHYFGVPLLGIRLDTAEESRHAFIYGLCWHLTEPGQRRPGFPSWSWTGWSGIITAEDRIWLSNTNSLLIPDVWIETAGGQLVSWPKAKQIDLLSKSHSLTRYIHVEGWIFCLRFEFLSQFIAGHFSAYDKPAGFYVQAELETFKYPPWLRLTKKVERGDDLHKRLLSEVWWGIAIRPYGTNGAVVLVVNVLEDCAERISYLNLSFGGKGDQISSAKSMGMLVERQRFRLG